jgi:hypothetical protein
VKLHGELSCSVVKVSYVVVLVGSSPDLDFLDETSGEKGLGLGILPKKPIGRNNPVSILFISLLKNTTLCPYWIQDDQKAAIHMLPRGDDTTM